MADPGPGARLSPRRLLRLLSQEQPFRNRHPWGPLQHWLREGTVPRPSPAVPSVPETARLWDLH